VFDSKDAKVFKALFERGDLRDFDNDHSKADYVLTKILLRAGAIGEQAIRIFAKSSLGQRKKWDRADYQERTLKAAEAALAAESNASDVQRIGIYGRTKTGFIFFKPTKDGEIRVPLSNFSAEITEDIASDDGVETTRHLKVVVTLLGIFYEVSVVASEFASFNWLIKLIGPRAVIYAGFATKDHVRAAVQVFSHNMVQRLVFAHTGWRRHLDQWLYLHGDGAIAADGQRTDVEVQLPDPLLRFRLPAPPTGDELVPAIRTFISVVNALRLDHVVLPLLGAPFRVVIGTTDFFLFLLGPTGTFKTELAALIQQFFGADFGRANLCSWSSTANFLESVASAAKDAVIVVDDFVLTGSVYDQQRTNREADRLLRAQGNNAGRGRMRADTTLRPTRSPRGMIVATGEELPRGQSLRARGLVTEIGKGEISSDCLTVAQQTAAAGIQAKIMSAYLKWLASRLDEVRRSMRADLITIRQREAANAHHARVPGIFADLLFGWKTFITFATEAGAFTKDEADRLLARVTTALRTAVSRQSVFQDSQEPARRFIELISSAIISGNAHVANMKGQAPANAELWGWRSVEYRDSSGFDAKGTRIGWLDLDNLYLDPDAAYKAAQTMAGPGTAINIGPQTLWKRLDEQGFLVTKETDKNRGHNTIRRSTDLGRRRVLHLRASSLTTAFESDHIENVQLGVAAHLPSHGFRLLKSVAGLKLFQKGLSKLSQWSESDLARLEETLYPGETITAIFAYSVKIRRVDGSEYEFLRRN
jgi:hypothetical protein